MKLIAFSIAALALLSSCNTTIGLGRDLRLLGGGIEKSADSTYNGGGGNIAPDPGGAPVY